MKISKVIKKICALLLTFIMIFSFLPPIIPVEATENDDTYVDFNASWPENKTEIEVNAGESRNIIFNIKLNSSQFKNMKMYVIDSSNPRATTNIVIANSEIIKSKSNNLVEFNNISGGKVIEGIIEVDFTSNNNFIEYTKNISIKLTGEYYNTEKHTTEKIDITKPLTAIVHPVAKNVIFDSTISLKSGSVSKNSLPIYENSRRVGYRVTNFTQTYYLDLYSGGYLKDGKLTISLNRNANSDSDFILEDDKYSVTFGSALTERFGEPIKTKDDETGAYKYTFDINSGNSTFNINNPYSINIKDCIITVRYTVDNPQDEGSSNYSLIADFTTTGWSGEQTSVTDINVEEKNINKNTVANDYIQLYLYTPGTYTWIQADYSTSKYSKSITSENLETLANGGDISLSYNTSIKYTYGSDNSNDSANFKYDNMRIAYYSETEGKVITKVLNNNEATLSSINARIGNGGRIQISGNNGSIGELTSENTTYTSEANKNDSVYFMNMIDFSHSNYGGYTSTYRISGEKLLQSGMTETDIKNILYFQTTLINNSSSNLVSAGNSASYESADSEYSKKSYMEFSLEKEPNIKISDYNKSISMNMTLSMYRNTDVFENTPDDTVKNENPKIYVKLPNDIKYNVRKVTLSGENSDYLSIKEWKTEKIEDSWYIIIDCDGTYTSDLGRIDINIEGYKKLVSLNPSLVQEVKAYLITDNENYLVKTNVLNIFEKNGKTVNSTYYMNKLFSIERTAGINVDSGIIRKENLGDVLSPTSEDAISSKSNPVKFTTDSDVICTSNVKVVGNYNMKNIKLISRLPIEGNKYIKNSGDIGSDISLTDLSNIIVKKNNIEITEGFTIKYSTDINANYDSTFSDEFSSDVKTILIECDSDFTLSSDDRLTLEYQMKMPEASQGAQNISGLVCAVQYTLNDDIETYTLEGAAAYVVNENPNGNITIHKKFQYCDENEQPAKATYGGIEFKLFNIDTEEYLSIDGKDVFTTDDNGRLEIQNVPVGLYELEEISEFDYYSGIDQILIEIENGNSVEVDAENKLKLGELKVQKLWEDSDKKDVVEFTITRKDGKGTPVTRTTDRTTGIATFKNIPYGSYTITETSGLTGWYLDDKSVDLFEETKTIEAENKISKGTIVLHKTVPINDTVEGLKFRIIGYGDVSYINKNGEEVNTDIDKTIVIDQTQSQENVIIANISEDKTSAVVVLTNLPMGIYMIEEVDMPKLDNGDNRYKNVSECVKIKENNEYLNVFVDNKWKTGNIKIVKTAKLGNKNISDLSGFSVNITGESEYGTTINKTISLDENGTANVELEIGKYTITENHIDGYDEYYISHDINGNEIRSKEPIDVTVEADKTVTQELFNDHTGVGYVKVIKTLESVDDAQKVIGAGIKFKVLGTNVAGDRVEEEIVIDKIETDSQGNEIAVGYSNAIPVGGEYELEEVEETVPDYFEGMESISIQLNTANTLENPLVMNVENTRGRGNLEITTVTDPVGGPLVPISYAVTEVEFGNDLTTYVKKEETRQILQASDGYAELRNIYSGNYLVEQIEVPEGYNKDVPQIVEVLNNNTGYANFEITKAEELLNNRVTFEKEIVNSNGEIATQEEIEAAKLNIDESFEIKLTNVENNNKVYYTFFGVNNSGTIYGLNAGTYEIEEVYKPKYITQNYYIKKDDQYELIEKKDDKYIFTIDDLQEGSQVFIKVQNKINTDFGFGGQNQKDNLSKVNTEVVSAVTKTIIYITDEDENAIPGASFVLKDSNGKVVNLPFANNTYITNSNYRVQINGLQKGKYTLECTGVPNGYLIPDSKEIMVYENATRVTRVEIQKNIDRGSILLSTYYNNEETQTQKYVSSSSYKVVNSDTNELVGFTKTPSGDYVKSNLPTALTTINIKSGIVQLRGIETGNYEVGIVGIKDGYGIIKEDAEYIGIEKDTATSVNVEVAKEQIVDLESGYENTMYVDSLGKVKIIGASDYGEKGGIVTGTSNNPIPSEIKLPETIKIVNISNWRGVVAIDSTGKVWSWGGNAESERYGSSSKLGVGINTGVIMPTCITDLVDTELNNAYKQGVRIVDVQCTEYSTILLDNNGKIWSAGAGEYCGNNNSGSLYFVCISDIENNPLNNIKVKKLYKSYYPILTDENDQTWLFNNGTVKCISDESTDDLFGIDVKKATVDSDGTIYAIDSNGIVWKGKNPYPGKWKDFAIASNADKKVCVINSNGNLHDLTSGIPTPMIETYNLDNFNNGILTSLYNGYYNILAIDKTESVWGIGTNYSGSFGQATGMLSGSEIIAKIPITYNKNLEFGRTFEKIACLDKTFLAIDGNGQLWGAGNQTLVGLGYNGSEGVLLHKIEIPGVEKFIDATIDNNGYGSAVISSNNELYRIDSNDSYSWKVEGKGIKFESVRNVKDVTVALATDGTVWTIGDKYGPTGSGVSDTLRCVLGDIIKIETTSNAVFALDKNGKVWFWGESYKADVNSTYPRCLTDSGYSVISELYNKGITITDIACYPYDMIILLDSTGMAWIIDNNHQVVKVTDKFNISSQSNIISDNFENKPNYKIVKVNAITSGFNILDNYGEWWYLGTELSNSYDNGIQSVQKVNKDGFIYQQTGKNIENITDIINDRYGNCAIIDGNGNIVFATGVLTQIKEEETAESNPLYNIKISEIVDDNKLRTTDGKLIDLNGTEVPDIDKMIEQNNISVKERYECDDFVIILDNNGKIWTQGDNEFGQLGNNTNERSDELICINDIVGTELNNTYTEHSDFRIEKVYVAEPRGRGYSSISDTIAYSIIAIDNYGKVWSWGCEAIGLLGNGVSNGFGNDDNKVNTPVCISNIEGTEFNKAYTENSNFRIESIEIQETLAKSAEPYWYSNATIIAKDNCGGVWTWGLNYNGQLGNGTNNTINTPYCINGAGTALEGKQISSFEVICGSTVGNYGVTSESNLGIVLTTDGELYFSGANLYISNITANEFYKVGIDEKVIKYKVFSNRYTNSGIYVQCENNLYGWGVISGSGVTEDPKKLIENVQMNQIEFGFAIDNNNKLWTLTVPGWELPESTCLTEVKKSKIYGIKFEEIIRPEEGGEIGNVILLKDVDGNIWMIKYDATISRAINIDNIVSCTKAIFGIVNEENIEKLIKNIGNTIEYNNNIWQITYMRLTDEFIKLTKLNTIQDNIDKDIVQSTSTLALDSEGNLYQKKQTQYVLNGEYITKNEIVCLTTTKEFDSSVVNNRWTVVNKQF